MIKFGEVLEKFPPELKDAVITLYDFLREEYVIKREEFEELKSIVKSLAIAQEKTEERLNQLTEKIEQLAEAQRETEERLNRLTERVEQLTEAQRKTEEELRSLAKTVKNIQKELGGLSHSIGFDLENQAYKALPEILKERYGIEIEERLLRKFIEYPDGREEEINIFGKGRKNGETIYIIGEAKTHLKLKDIDLFKRQLERINRVIPDKKFPIFVVHSSSPKVVKYAEDNGFPVFFSYEF